MMHLFDQMEILGRVLLDDAPKTPGSEEAIRTAAAALQFIDATGQVADFEDYVRNLEAYAPPLAIARFDTRQDADAWLMAQKRPPVFASILVADEYYSVFFNPTSGWRALGRQPRLEFYLQEMADERRPPSGLSFATKAEAEAWMNQQPTPPQQVIIDIAGAPYLAAYHHRIDYRVLYPLPAPTPPSQET
ncbi:head protein [Corallococcus sp. AS-1-6]|uniref:head protein n=1 Tax=Corallococcus sp. AS-1-6 TaxID=2874599 RepID=UPI001CBB8195|nr:head protein [Corallococcus sp. AS-1-6]MBZ4372005.1 head protein [Corallococcus sp. AS-1-6]